MAKARLSEKFEKLEYEKFQNSRCFLPRFCPGPAIENLSSKVLTPEETHVLSKGPKFCLPQTQVNFAEIVSNVEAGIFGSRGAVENPDLLRGEVVKNILDFIPYSPRLKNQETQTLKKLKKDPHIIITRADKGNKIVILDKTSYNTKVTDILSDTHTYKPIDSDPTDKFTRLVRKELGILQTERLITPQMYKLFYPKGCSAPKFYGLPKIHKDGVPLRPIVASYSSPTARLGKWLSTLFRPLMQTQTSYIRNSVHLVEKLKDIEIKKDTILASFDAISMYTSCDIKKCELALQRKLEDNIDQIDYKTLDIETIMRLVRLCNSSSSYFRYNNQFFTQIRGLPMGTSLSPFLATFYMEFIEISALENFPMKHRFWGRFVDDVISLWEHGGESLNSFLTHLNTLDSNLQFTLELEHNHKLPFLDVLIFNKSPGLEFSIYRKPTHNDRYLHFSSNHSPCIKRGVVISLVDRVIRICSEPHIDSELNYIKDILFCNGYPIKLLETIIDRRRKKAEGSASGPQAPTDTVPLVDDKKLFTVLPYIPKLSDKLKRILKKHKLSVAFKNSNITQNFFNNGKDKTSPILGSGVYRIPCSCGCFYVGRTQQQLGERLSEHKSSIDKAMRLRQRPEVFDSALAQHVYESPHHFILFDETSIVAPVKGLTQVFREAVEIKKHIHQKVALNRDTGETFLSPIYDKIINSDRFYIHPQSYIVQSNRVSDNNQTGKRSAFKSALRKMKF